MFEWLAAAASSVILGSSTPGILHKIKNRLDKHPQGKERTFASADLACVAAAVAAREASLTAGIKTHGGAVTGAYTERASALAGAYTATSTPAIRHTVKKTWESFNTALRTARKNWHTARESAWAQFRVAVKKCKANIEVLDTENAASETTGE